MGASGGASVSLSDPHQSSEEGPFLPEFWLQPSAVPPSHLFHNQALCLHVFFCEVKAGLRLHGCGWEEEGVELLLLPLVGSSVSGGAASLPASGLERSPCFIGPASAWPSLARSVAGLDGRQVGRPAGGCWGFLGK